ncbi:6-bladed beta-propeller [Bacteroides sp. 214]|uniref:6-bladed beta-propeller n=1 Tax=Bacteroides sp. 214 TaxID=2302935 RepID=UPI0013D10F93|nr:6-bladed beta-propeller [Bacteroides sp. 214]NDW11633.1 6-bladed beta-propeller [Bacteroides sp. 214]
MNQRLKTTAILLIGLLCCYSCQEKNKKGIATDSEEILTVNLDAPDDEVSFYDIFDRVSVIQLETTEESLIRTIWKIVFHNDSIFVFDRPQQTIFLFDANGKYLSKLCKVGNGPGEYSSISDFAINKFTNNIELLSPMQGVFCYDLNFNFIEKIVTPEGRVIHSFAIIDACTRVFHNHVRENNLEVFDCCSNEKTGEYYNIPKDIYFKSGIVSPFSCFENRQEGEATFTQSFTHTVYSITRDSFKPRYTWDFGKYNFDLKKDLDLTQSAEEWKNFIESKSFKENHIFSLGTNTETSSFYLANFMFWKEQRNITVIHNKATGKQIKFSLFKEGVCFPNYAHATEDFIYPCPMSMRVIDSYLNDQIRKENNISLEWDEDQNPIIMKYYLKKN